MNCVHLEKSYRQRTGYERASNFCLSICLSLDLSLSSLPVDLSLANDEAQKDGNAVIPWFMNALVYSSFGLRVNHVLV